jgi:hypothetical protein
MNDGWRENCLRRVEMMMKIDSSTAPQITKAALDECRFFHAKLF